MQKSMTQLDIEQFYRDVDKLEIRHPIAEVARVTGFSKGMVSVYLNRKEEPSDNFIKAFYKGFGEDLKKFSNSLVNEGQQEYGGDILGLIKQMVENTSTLVESNLILTKTNATQTTMLQEQLQRVGSFVVGKTKDEKSILAEYQDRLIRGGIGKHWFDYSEGLAELNRLSFPQKEDIKKSIRKSADISGK